MSACCKAQLIEICSVSLLRIPLTSASKRAIVGRAVAAAAAAYPSGPADRLLASRAWNGSVGRTAAERALLKHERIELPIAVKTWTPRIRPRRLRERVLAPTDNAAGKGRLREGCRSRSEASRTKPLAYGEPDRCEQGARV